MIHSHNIKLDIISSIPVMYIEGDLTSDANADTNSVYLNIKEKHSSKKLIINFEQTKYMNSSGIAILLYIIQDVQEQDGAIAFVGMSSHLEKIINIIGISDLIPMYPSNAEAIKAL